MAVDPYSTSDPRNVIPNAIASRRTSGATGSPRRCRTKTSAAASTTCVGITNAAMMSDASERIADDGVDRDPAGPWRLDHAPEGGRREHAEQQKTRVPARVLREPDVVVAHRREKRDREALPAAQEGAREPVHGWHRGDAEHRCRQAHAPVMLAEEPHARELEQRVHEVLVRARERPKQLAHAYRHRVLERPDLVDPEVGVETIESKRGGQQGDERQDQVFPRTVRARMRRGGYSPPRRGARAM